MPIYEYKCPECGKEIEYTLPLSSYDAPIYCHDCWDESNGKEHIRMNKIYSKISLGYTTRFKDVERKASEEGFIIKEPGIDKDARQAKKYREEKIRKDIRRTVEQTVMDHVF